MKKCGIYRSTPKQIRILSKEGFKHVENWTWSEATEMLVRLAKSGWRIPEGINPPEYTPERKETEKVEYTRKFFDEEFFTEDYLDALEKATFENHKHELTLLAQILHEIREIKSLLKQDNNPGNGSDQGTNSP
jgi:hypothetical protein